jgi:hypothetical protein
MRELTPAGTRFTAAAKCLVAAWYLAAAQYLAPSNQAEFEAEPGTLEQWVGRPRLLARCASLCSSLPLAEMPD